MQAGLPGWAGWDPCQLRQVRALVSGPAGLSRPVWGPPNSQQQHPSLHPSYQGHKTHSSVSLEPSALLHASFPQYMHAGLSPSPSSFVWSRVARSGSEPRQPVYLTPAPRLPCHHFPCLIQIRDCAFLLVLLSFCCLFHASAHSFVYSFCF